MTGMMAIAMAMVKVMVMVTVVLTLDCQPVMPQSWLYFPKQKACIIAMGLGVYSSISIYKDYKGLLVLGIPTPKIESPYKTIKSIKQTTSETLSV